MRTIDLSCVGYSVKTDIYNESGTGPVVLALIGRTSYRKKKRYGELGDKLAERLNATTVVFDYTGHGDSPFNIEDLSPAQHFLEVVTVFDWIVKEYPDRPVVVIGSSYGGFQATQLTKYRKFNGLILRAPAIYKPNAFYTLKKNEDTEATQLFRRDVEALAKHPLLARASSFSGKVMLIVHENDEQIPKETTDAYANAFHPKLYVAEGFPHSLDTVEDVKVEAYNQKMSDWIAKEV